MSAASPTHEAPMKKLLRSLRKTWNDTYSLRTRKQTIDNLLAPSAEESSENLGDLGAAIGPEISTLVDSGKLEVRDLYCGQIEPNHAASAAEQSIPVTPSLIRSMTGMLTCADKIGRLRTRERRAKHIHLYNEEMLDNVQEALANDPSAQQGLTPDDPKLKKIMVAYQTSQNVIESLIISAHEEESDLAYFRGQFEDEMEKLLAPFLTIPELEEEVDYFPEEEGSLADSVSIKHSPKLLAKDQLETDVKARNFAANNRLLARQQLQEINERLESHFTSYEAQVKEYHKLVASGEFELPLSEWQIQHLLLGQEYTQAVAAAEDAYSEAATEARRLGAIPLSMDQSSRFAEDSVDENEVDEEVKFSITNTDMDAIDQWYEKVEDPPMDSDIQGILEGLSQLGSIHVDEDPHCRAVGRERKRIDRWDDERQRRWVSMLEQDIEKPTGLRKMSVVDAIQVHELDGQSAEDTSAR